MRGMLPASPCDQGPGRMGDVGGPGLGGAVGEREEFEGSLLGSTGGGQKIHEKFSKQPWDKWQQRMVDVTCRTLCLLPSSRKFKCRKWSESVFTGWGFARVWWQLQEMRNSVLSLKMGGG